ncbi:PAS domain-containing protein [Candidatus Reidiella endopervernicosa]|uniref:PAS domain S-box protein n=1 Tax=Candidatus Reidiella endopervernicosa TaxID=2738883 RepID=A0A6N0HXR5_9GAMM|nr:PAS domain-containing protein [Candidatus Reidiella endopervernicosa]QKQ26976.1 PAS domain S-box protein [Candidatus Reidiella endopervernicosa]
MKRLILVPVIENEQVVMLTGVGNKPSDYVEQDMETVQLIANEIWRIVQNRRYLSAVKESEQRFNTFMETIPGIAWIKDAQGRHLYMNEYACKVFGIGQEQAPGTTIFDLLSHEVAERCWASDQAVIESGKSSEFIEVFPDQDGHTETGKYSNSPSKVPRDSGCSEASAWTSLSANRWSWNCRSYHWPSSRAGECCHHRP